MPYDKLYHNANLTLKNVHLGGILNRSEYFSHEPISYIKYSSCHRKIKRLQLTVWIGIPS